MNRTCVVDAVTRVVVNVVELGAAALPDNVAERTAPPAGFLYVSHATAGPGWRLEVDGVTLTDPNPPRPLPTAAEVALAQLRQNDEVAFRLLEALVDVLLAKGVIAGTDFPAGLRTLYQNRKALRATAGVP
jgi:hypothetical protein